MSRLATRFPAKQQTATQQPATQPPGTQSSHTQPQWLFKAGLSACWLPETPTISSTGQVTLKADANFVLAFRDWLGAWVAGKAQSFNCELISHDYKLEAKTRYDLKFASITSLGFPTLDGKLESPGRLTVNLQATGVTQQEAASGQSPVFKQRSSWKCGNFRLMIAGLNTSRVARIEGFTTTSPGVLPDLNIFVSMVDSQGFIEMHESGLTAPASIHYLSSDMKTSLFTLAFTTKIVSLMYVTGSAQANQIAQLPITLMARGASLSKG